MITAQTVAKIHLDRDDEIINHIKTKVDEFLGDSVWLLSNDSHTRTDGKIRYDFDIVQMLRAFVQEDERPWPSQSVKDQLAKHYYERGFEASFTSSDDLILYVDLNNSVIPEQGDPSHV